MNHIGPHDIVRQGACGTVLAETLEYYRKVLLRPTGYGQNLALMLLVELLTWKRDGRL